MLWSAFSIQQPQSHAAFGRCVVPVRSPPACSKQRFPAATPHVGQGTASKCLGVMSPILIRKGYLNSFRKAVRFGTLRGLPSAMLTQCLIDAARGQVLQRLPTVPETAFEPVIDASSRGTWTINVVESMGRRNTQLELTGH